MPEPGPRSGPDAAPDPHGYWRANLQLVTALLVVWAVVSFGCGIFFVEPLNGLHLAGFPLGFWFAHQGSIYTFIVLIWVYARLSDRIARRFGVS